MRARMIRRRNERAQLSIDRQAQPETDPAVWTLVIAFAAVALVLLYWVTG